MGERTWGSKYRSSLICIDSYANNIPVGWISNPYLQEPIRFHGMVQLLKSMERLLDEMHLPQSFTEKRTFASPSAAAEPDAPPKGTAGERGALATFSVNILFRQNASWQGVLTWLDAKQEESFRSVLEFITLMDSALSA